jgi:hypothetical protein
VEPDTPREPSVPATSGELHLIPELDAAIQSARPASSQLPLMLVGAAGAVAGLAIVLVFSGFGSDTTAHTASAPAAVPAPAPAPPPAAAESVPPPTWTGSRKASWAYDGSRTIAFELAATRDLPVWMAQTRPMLVVRCLSRVTEVFVELGTSTSFEQEADRRTVRVQWNDEPEAVQQWENSDTGQELFAPDGVAFVRQLVQARRLRFGFTPFNAQPVTAEFVVQDFEPMAALVAGTCGWRLTPRA